MSKRILRNQYGEFDLSKAKAHPAVKNPRVIVSVAFSKAEFEQVSDAAGSQRVSTFIRDSAKFMARMKRYESEHYTTEGNDTIVTRK